jgi:hypothetical protein
VRAALELDVEDGPAEALSPISPTHRVRISGLESGALIRLAEESLLDRDFVVRWSPL